MSKMNENTLWYDKPSDQNWTSALPVGNGTLGAMVTGDVGTERIQMNLDSLWARHKGQTDNPESAKHLDEVRSLLMEGRPDEAMALANTTMMAIPNRIQPYQTMGDLTITGEPSEAGLGTAEKISKAPVVYRRWLDLTTGVTGVRWHDSGVNYERVVYASKPDNVLVIHMTCDVPGQLSLSVRYQRAADAYAKLTRGGVLAIHGRCGAHGVRFEGGVKMLAEGGKILSKCDVLRVQSADSVTLIVAAAGDFFDKEPAKVMRSTLKRAAAKGHEKLLDAHAAEHRVLFERVSLKLAHSKAEQKLASLPTDERLGRVKAGKEDPGLVELYFQYGRYLLMGSSRPGSLPANLQGIWNDMLTPSWNSDFHTNINLQMNYWPAEVANLSECHQPLFDWMKRLAKSGKKTAKIHYNCRGWVCHHVSNPWGFSGPGDMPRSGLWPTGGAWLCDHLWEHYLFTSDKAFLKETAYPLMKGACEFFIDYLIKDEQGRYLCGPSTSPENKYSLPDGRVGHLCMASTMDNQILRELFDHTLEAAKLLKRNEGLQEKMKDVLEHLPVTKIASDGRLMEWMEQYEEPDPGHRHISHLFGLHPGTQISPRLTPDLAKAASRTLEHRLKHGGGHTGWSAAWMVNHYARLHDGQRAYGMLETLLKRSTRINLFDDHPPFQIDGNFGACAGIIEMLLQSYAGEIEFLPALPEAWATGSVTGLRARPGVTVSFAWENHRFTQATIVADHDCKLTVRVSDKQRIGSVSGAEFEQNEDAVVVIDAQKAVACTVKTAGK